MIENGKANKSQMRSLKIKLFSLLTVSLVVLIIISAAAAYFFTEQHTSSKRYYEIKVLSQDIIYFDEVLTMSTTAAAHSGDIQWQKRYNKYVSFLDSALTNASNIDETISTFIKDSSAANNKLVAYEEEVFSLVRKNQKQQALAVLNSDDYQSQKISFSSGIKKAVDSALIDAGKAVDNNQRRQGLYLTIGMVISFFTVICLWFYLINFIQLSDKIMEGLIATDELSSLSNRREFNETLSRELNRAYRDKTTLMLAIFDLDNFKKYNDNYGHPAGDNVIIQIGSTLKHYNRRSNESAYRVGGEEFAMLTTCQFKSDALSKVDLIVNKVHELNIPHQHNENYERVTISCGVAFYTVQNNLSASELYKNADVALYKAKEAGRNRFEVFDQ